MKQLLLGVLLVVLCQFSTLKAADTLQVREPRVPILIERQDNVLFYLRLDSRSCRTLDEVVLEFAETTNMKDIKAVKLYYGGTETVKREGKTFFCPVEYIPRDIPGKTLAAHPSYSVLKKEIKSPLRQVVFPVNQSLVPGINYFWVSIQMKPKTPLLAKVEADIVRASADGKILVLRKESPSGIERLMGTGVRHAGDDGLHFVFRDWLLLIRAHCWAFMMFVIIVRQICRNILMSV